MKLNPLMATALWTSQWTLRAVLHAEVEHAPPFGVRLDLKILREVERNAPACMAGTRRGRPRVPLLLRPLEAKGVSLSWEPAQGYRIRIRVRVRVRVRVRAESNLSRDGSLESDLPGEAGGTCPRQGAHV